MSSSMNIPMHLVIVNDDGNLSLNPHIEVSIIPLEVSPEEFRLETVYTVNIAAESDPPYNLELLPMYSSAENSTIAGFYFSGFHNSCLALLDLLNIERDAVYIT